VFLQISEVDEEIVEFVGRYADSEVLDTELECDVTSFVALSVRKLHAFELVATALHIRKVR
jgi:hypothetical protein